MRGDAGAADASSRVLRPLTRFGAQAFGRIAYWQKCVPGGADGAHLNGDETLAYSGGTYLFMDANGFLVERSIRWCKLEISDDGLKLAIILPVGLFMSVGVVGALAQVVAKHAEKKRLAEVEAQKREEEQESVTDLSRSTRLSREGGEGQREVQWGRTRVVDDEAIEVDAAHS